MNWGLGLSALSVVLLWIGLHGRRVGNHPTCRRCGFDLFGKPPESRVCSECGTDLNRRRAVRIGHRRRRWRLIAFAALLLLFGAGGIVYQVMGARVNWKQYEPAVLLVQEANSSSPSRRDAALLELLRRLQNGKLERGIIDRLVNRALALQIDASSPWSVLWGELVERAWRAGDVSNAQWERYWRQAFAFSLSATGATPPGEPLNVSVTCPVPTPRYSGVPVGIECRAVRLNVGGIECDPNKLGLAAGANASPTRLTLGVAGPNEIYYTAGRVYLSPKEGRVPMARARTKHPLIGETQVSADLIISIDRSDLARSSDSLPVNLTTTVHLPVGVVPVELVRAPRMRPGVEKSLHVEQVILTQAGPEPETYFAQFTIDGPPPPIDGCFDVELHQAGADFGWNLGPLQCRIGQPSHAIFRHKITWHPNRLADVVLKPSAEKAGPAGMEQIWGEPLVIRVPVVGPPRDTGS